MAETTKQQAPKTVEFTVTHPKGFWWNGKRQPTGAVIKGVAQADADEMTRKGLGEVVE